MGGSEKIYLEELKRSQQDRAERWEVRGLRLISRLFASFKIRRQRVLPGSVYIILALDESNFILTRRGTKKNA